jgi:hypothetical protein
MSPVQMSTGANGEVKNAFFLIAAAAAASSWKECVLSLIRHFTDPEGLARGGWMWRSEQ